MSAHLIYHSSAARSRCFRHFFVPIAPQGGRRGSKENRRRRTRSASLPSAAPRPAPLRRRKAQHLSRRWTFPPFCTTMIFAREDIPPPRTHAPVAQLDRVSDSDSEGHRFDSCRVYHKKRKSNRNSSLRFFHKFAMLFLAAFPVLSVCQYFANCIIMFRFTQLHWR